MFACSVASTCPSDFAAAIIARIRLKPSDCCSLSLAGLNGVSRGGGSSGTLVARHRCAGARPACQLR